MYQVPRRTVNGNPAETVWEVLARTQQLESLKVLACLNASSHVQFPQVLVDPGRPPRLLFFLCWAGVCDCTSAGVSAGVEAEIASTCPVVCELVCCSSASGPILACVGSVGWERPVGEL